LYADALRPAGEGALYQEFMRLKAKLETEGLFDLDRKRAIPLFPNRIGIVTSPTGAALRDMLDTLRRRYPLVEVVLAPASVQGDAAPAEIVAALERLNEFIKPDVILLARGGGSIEDLWAFNDERVARAIVASHAPVISGVGHETDFTIADFAADLRAPTPTAAAELATPDRRELDSLLRERLLDLARAAQTAISDERWRLNDARNRLERRSPAAQVRGDRQRLDEIIRRAEKGIIQRARLQRAGLQGLAQKLAALSPQAVLGRGFAAVTQADGRLVRRVKDVKVGDALGVQVSDGSFSVEVTK
jgi:exodeoxyribonuclease VII large subunit